jgi:hypothetical protein
VWNYRRTATAVDATKVALVNAFIANVIPKIKLALNNRYTGTNITVRWLNDAQDAPSLTAEVGVGNVAGDGMTTANAAFMLFKTALRGRSYRGGKHMFPLSESNTTAGTEDLFNAGALTLFGDLATAALAQLTDATGNVWNPCIVSRVLSQLKVNPTTVTANDVTSIAINKRIGTMRHRKVKTVY